MASCGPLYETIAGTSRRVRLLRLKAADRKRLSFSLSTVDLDDAKEAVFIALSYAWGSADDMRSIQVNGQQVQIRRNLFDFLVHFARYVAWRDRYIWIDQLCIDQSSLEEKNHQVSMMGEIYSRAESTLIWLGEDEDSGLAFDAIEKVCSKELAEQKADAMWERPWNPVCSAAQISALKTMTDMPYWRRHWVAQEALLSRSAIVLYGDKAMPLLRIRELELLGFNNAMTVFTLGFSATEAESPHARLWNYATRFARHSFCEKPVDKVYGMQSIFRKELRIKVNYSATVRDAFLDFVRSWYVAWPLDEPFSLQLFLNGCLDLAVGMGIRHAPNEVDSEESRIWKDHENLDPMWTISLEEERWSIRAEYDCSWRHLQELLKVHVLKGWAITGS